jgi:hypothetical protein
VKKPVPVARVRVFTGRGTGRADFTHGLPMPCTRCGCCKGANWFKALSVKGYNDSKVDRQKLSILCTRDEQINRACSEEETRVGVEG